jgi:hypothetical protein
LGFDIAFGVWELRFMDVTQALVKVRLQLSELQRRRGKLEGEFAQLSAEIAASEEEERVLRRIAERYDLQIAGQQPPLPQEVLEWRDMSRTTAIARVLEEALVPQSPSQITRSLREKGRNDEYHAVSAALAHLKRAGRADNQVSRGKWVLVSDEMPQADRDVTRALTGRDLIMRELALAPRRRGAPKPAAEGPYQPGAADGD